MNTKINHGFTLIEVLIAMSLLSIMMALLFAGLKICTESWYKGENKINQVNEVAVVYNFFQQQLALAKPVVKDFKTSDIQSSFAFQGKQHALQFASAFPVSVGRLGLQLFSIDLAKEDDEQVIKVTITPLFTEEDDRDAHKEEVVLLRGASDLSMSYFGAEEGGDINSASWHDEWIEKNSQPQLVKITIQRDDDLFWPEMIIPLKITGQYNIVEQIDNAVTE